MTTPIDHPMIRSAITNGIRDKPIEKKLKLYSSTPSRIATLAPITTRSTPIRIVPAMYSEALIGDAQMLRTFLPHMSSRKPTATDCWERNMTSHRISAPRIRGATELMSEVLRCRYSVMKPQSITSTVGQYRISSQRWSVRL